MNPLVFLAGFGVMVALAGAALGVSALTGGGAVGDAGRARSSGLTVRRSWLVAAGVGLGVLVLTGWVAVAAGAAWAVVVVPAILGSGAQAERRIARLEALAGWTRRLSDLLASGAAGSLDEALRRSSATCPAAIEPEVTAMVARLDPQGIERALRAFGKDLDDPAGDHVTMALILRARNGGRGLAKVLVNLSGDVDDQVRMRRQIRAERAKPMNTIKGLVVLTVVVWGLSAVFLREYLAPYSTPDGQVALTFIVGLFGFALAWLRRLSQPVVGPRFLADLDDQRSPGR